MKLLQNIHCFHWGITSLTTPSWITVLPFSYHDGKKTEVDIGGDASGIQVLERIGFLVIYENTISTSEQLPFLPQQCWSDQRCFFFPSFIVHSSPKEREDPTRLNNVELGRKHHCLRLCKERVFYLKSLHRTVIHLKISSNWVGYKVVKIPQFCCVSLNPSCLCFILATDTLLFFSALKCVSLFVHFPNVCIYLCLFTSV